jgi:hypothetical protein
MELIGIDNHQIDFNENLKMLEMYGYLKLVENQAAKKNSSKDERLIQSNYDKKHLKKYLHELPAFGNFFEKNTTFTS